MDFQKIERRFLELQKQREDGQLNESGFRFEVAKLMLRDERGIFWMIDADSGAWFCNRGEEWEPGDPSAETPLVDARPDVGKARGRTVRRVVLVGAILLALLAVTGWWLFSQGILTNPFFPAPTPSASITVNIASPADGSEVTLGQEVAIESTIDALTDLQTVAQVLLQANGQAVDIQSVRAKIQPQQLSLPLSQRWRPTTTGEYQVAVSALADGGESLGVATITLQVVEPSSDTLPEPACTPDATFVRDVTIAAGTAFPPEARMDKVWQVRNSGTCAWGVGYDLVLVDGAALGAPSRVPAPPTAAGETADLSLTFQAPAAPGAYANLWQLQGPDGQFFGPQLVLSIVVEAQAEESLPPDAPAGLAAAIQEDGDAIHLTWEDRSDNEDAFRIYREDVEASIGLAPANARLFVDEEVACGHVYRYGVVAFNAAGVSPISETVEVVMPACAPPDSPPTLMLSVVPTQVLVSELFTITFEASDDVAMDLVIVWGEQSGEPELDMGRLFTCTGVLCTATWPITVGPGILETRPPGGGVPLTVLAIARDSSGQESELVRAKVAILPLD